MAKPDWLSIEEISRLWGEETGLDASAFKKDLEEWFAEFVKQSPASQSLITGKGGDTTNRLMGMLGARYLERPTFEAYCEERGHPKPRFWFGGWFEQSRRDEPSGAEPDGTSPEATPPQRGEDRPHARQASAGQASDPELEAFQTQIASMSERLKAPSFEVPRVGTPSAADHRELGSERGQAGPSTERIHQELIERAEAASAEARQLEAQLEAAEQRIADLNAAASASNASSPARPFAPGPASPEAPWHEPAPSIPSGQQASGSYQDPSATGRLLRQRKRHGKGRGRAILAAGLTVSVVAVAGLLYWGAETVTQPIGGEQAPTSAVTADTMPGSGSTVSGPPTAGTETAAVSSERAAGKLDPAAAVSPADAQDLAATRGEIARLTASLEASDSVIARLRDELAIARQAVETARRTRPANTNPEAETRQRQLALEATAEASSLRAALAGAEQKLAALDTQLDAALDTAADADTRAADARAEAARLHAALQQAKNQTGDKRQDLTLAATVSSVRVASLQRKLATAQQQIAELGRARDAANANASGLRASLQRAQEQAEAIRQELTLEVTASSARVATLQKELRAAQLRIADLSAAAEAAEDEAAKLREELAARQQGAAATGSPDPGSGSFEQVAALAPTEVSQRTDAVADTVSPDDLLLEPGSHLGREVVVTGSVVWLLWRYRLQSDSGLDSMVVDVEALRPADQSELEDAIDRVGVLGQVHARIRGTIVRQGEESYRLAASELAVVE